MAGPWSHALLVLGALGLVLTPAGLGDPGADNSQFTIVAHLQSSAVPFDVHGDRLVWFEKGASADQANLVMENLTDRSLQVLTNVRSDAAGLRIESLSFDGRWVAWCDNRFGNFEVFAFDTAAGSLQRVTEAGADDIEASVDAGRIAWSRSSQVWLHDLGNGTTWQLAATGQAREPALSGETVAWIRLEANERYLVSSSVLGGEQRVVARVKGTFVHDLHADGGLLAWEAWTLRDPAAPVKGYRSTVVQALRIAEGTVLNLTTATVTDPSRGMPLGTAVGGGRVAWFDGASGYVRSWPDGQRPGPLPSDPTAMALSDRFLVVSETPSTGTGDLVVRPWSAPAGAHAWPMPALGVAVAVACLAGVAARRRP